LRRKIKWYEKMALNAFISALKGPIGVTIRNLGVLNIAKAFEIACREERLVALESVDPDSRTQRSESRDKSTDETQKQEHEKEEPQVLETGIWSQYQWGGNNPPPFPMPFAMPGMNE